VRYSDLTGGRGATVAVIGAGASGTLAATYLLRAAAAARTPLRIVLIDRWGQHGLGRAYATQNPAHLLNSPVDRMSAVAGDPGHLARWAAANGIRHDGFLSRVAFGRYLRELLADAERTAAPTATVARITSDVVGLTYSGSGRPLRLDLAAQGHLDADAAVLATGNASPATPFPVPASPRYIRDPWIPGILDGVADGSPVVILGTGLTMLDVAISLTGTHPRTVVHAVSRHALVPREHQAPPGRAVQPPAVGVPDLSPADLTGLIRYVRVAAAQAPDGWQAVVDALRPHIPGLWQRLSLPDKRLFLRHVARYWEVHRHRVPPATARRIDQLRSAGRLSVQRGRIVAVAEKPAGLCVRIEHGGQVTEIAACSTAAWPGRTRSGSASRLTPAGPCSTRPARRATSSSRSARRCGASCTRPPLSRRSVTRPPRSRTGCSPPAATGRQRWPSRARRAWREAPRSRVRPAG
jgi:uncharacterized NAD(P)/FAD-binding protein YdhS